MPESQVPQANPAVPSSQPDPLLNADPLHGIDLFGFARITAQLAVRRPRQAVLSGAGLDEEQWQSVEKAWGLRLAAAAQRMDTAMLLQFERAMASAQQACEAPAPTRPMSDYAQMVAALERGVTPIEICAAYGMKLDEFFALQQAYTRRISSDPAEADRFSRLVEARQTELSAAPDQAQK